MAHKFDPILIEVMKNESSVVAEDRGITMKRTARSFGAKEGSDFSTAPVDMQGCLIAQALTPVELGRTSVRRNALIAGLLHRIDFIEKAGTGIRRIREEAKRLDYPEPEFDSKAFVTVIFRPNPQIRTEAEKVKDDRVAEGITPQVTPQDRLLWAMEGEMTGQELRQVLALKDTKHFRKTYLQPALDAGLIEMTLPDKPHSRRQRYRLTPVGSTQRQRPVTTG